MNETRSTTMKEVYNIIERDNAKPVWTRVGIGFVNRDNSINIILESLPLNGKLHVRDPRPSNAVRKES